MRLIDRLMIGLLRAGIGTRSTALLETRGRRSGHPRLTPVTNALDGDRFWIVTEHGTRSTTCATCSPTHRCASRPDGSGAGA